MMRRLAYFATVTFWLLVLAFWAGGRLAPPPAPAAAVERGIALAEVARYDQPEDCWMVIRGGVYDVGAYLPEHPSRPALVLPWCGKEASEAYATKGKGKPHSAAADALLEEYRIGRVEP